MNLSQLCSLRSLPEDLQSGRFANIRRSAHRKGMHPTGLAGKIKGAFLRAFQLLLAQFVVADRQPEAVGEHRSLRLFYRCASICVRALGGTGCRAMCPAALVDAMPWI